MTENIKIRIYLKNILINVLIAYFIIHPYSMIVFEYFGHGAAASPEHSMHKMAAEKTPGTGLDIVRHFWHSFSLEMLPMSLSYIFLGAVIGFALSRREYETVLEKARVEKANVELKRLNKMKDDFLAVCSHDLKAPLCGVSMCMQLIESQVGLSEIQKQFVETGIKNLTVMEKFIHEILHLSKLESGMETLNLSEVEINGFIDEVVNGMKDYSASQKIEIVSDHLSSAMNFKADRLKLTRIFNNLISNAVKFAKKTVKLEVRAENGKIYFTVSDDGPGISKEDQGKIFNKFEQAKNRKLLNLNDQGTGLGLTIVKELVELHNGAVTIDCAAGTGAMFIVALPVDPKV